jgi:hypothetical protein
VPSVSAASSSPCWREERRARRTAHPLDDAWRLALGSTGGAVGVTRTGAAWDVLAVAALLAPLAGVGVLAAGKAGGLAVRAGRLGALAAGAAWVAVLAAGAAPEVGRLSPDPLAVAAACGAALLAAGLASDEGGIVATASPVVASVVALVVGVVAEPSDLGRGQAVSLVAVGAAAALVVADLRGTGRLALVLLPAALLAGLRGAGELADPPTVLAPVLAAVALASGVHRQDRTVLFLHTRPLPPAAVVAVGSLAVAAAPVEQARAGGVLLAAAAVVVAAVPANPWAIAAAAPGAALAAAGLADVPVPDGPNPLIQALLALLLAGAAAVAVEGALRAPRAPRAVPALDARAAVAVVAVWLVVLPSSWGWALPGHDVAEAWTSAARVALVAAAATVLARDLLLRRARR